jgi:4-hydroxy-tetrahydrodipicolinate synthase
MALFTGSGVALITPFTEKTELEVNFEKIGQLIEWHIEEGTDAIIVCGTTGEAPTLPDDQHQEIIEFSVKRVNKRVPLIAGTGSNYTDHAVMMSQFAEAVGADGLLCVTPYYNRPTQKGLIANYTTIADAVNIPIIMYNVPSRTGVNMQPATVAELAAHKNIQGLKEASGNISQVVEIARLVPDDFYIYSGDDAITVPVMSLKGKGVVSTAANIIPRDMHDLTSYCLANKWHEACELQFKTKPLIDALFCETNPVPAKTALNLMGKDVGKTRLPLADMEDKNLELLKRRMREYGLIETGY